MKSAELEARQLMVDMGRSLYERGFTYGSAGNLSVRLDDVFLMTPTNISLGALRAESLSLVDIEGRLLSGSPATKECFLHLALYRTRPEIKAIVHLHSTYSVAVSCLADIDPDEVLPPLTPYYVMRVGKVVLVPYFPPGDSKLAQAVSERSQLSRALLLANHGPIVGEESLEAAVYAAEELEETAKLYLLLRHEKVRLLSEDQVLELRARYPKR